MTLENMVKMDELRKQFRLALSRSDRDGKDFAIECMTKCCGEFEEQTMIENLREEVLDFYELAG